MKMIWCGLKITEDCYVLVNQFHGNSRSKTLGCRKNRTVSRDIKWCFNASWILKGLRGNYFMWDKRRTFLQFSRLVLANLLTQIPGIWLVEISTYHICPRPGPTPRLPNMWVSISAKTTAPWHLDYRPVWSWWRLSCKLPPPSLILPDYTQCFSPYLYDLWLHYRDWFSPFIFTMYEMCTK